MLAVIIVYVILGLLTLLFLYKMAIDEGVNGDIVISYFPREDDRQYLRDHPNAYRLIMVFVCLCVIFFWPMFLINCIT